MCSVARRIILGRKSDGTVGVFVSKPGYDAYTATGNDLTLNVNSKVSQLIMHGWVGSGTTYIPLGFSRNPIVFVTSSDTIAGYPGYGDLFGPFRPSPLGLGVSGYDLRTKVIMHGGTAISIVAFGASRYELYNEALP